jgi:two-component system nitrogen regulation response regulator GlnG/two-component system response regulator HydG
MPHEDIITLSDLERQHIIRALKEAKNNRKRASEILGIHRNTLTRKIKEHKITPDEI